LKDKTLVTVVASIVVGVVITLTSGLFRTPLERMGVDVVRSGFPLVWSMRVIPRPINVLWGSFLVDVIFWALIGFVAVSTAAYLGRTRTTEQPIPPKH
jgi:hypothetical protein